MEPIEIDGYTFTLLRDVDQGSFGRLSFSGKVAYLEARVDGILISPCRAGMKRAVETDEGLILVTAICAGISAAGTFLKGQRSPGQDRRCFLAFVTAYMNGILTSEAPPGFPTWAEWLYGKIRCGLAHSFTIEAGGMKLQDFGGYVRIENHGPEIHAPTLLEDFASGWARYLAGVGREGTTTELGQNFDTRFNEIFHD